MDQLQELLTDELGIYMMRRSKLVKALPEVAKAVTDTELKQGFSSTVVTKNQVTRLDRFLSCWANVQRASPAKR